MNNIGKVTYRGIILIKPRIFRQKAMTKNRKNKIWKRGCIRIPPFADQNDAYRKWSITKVMISAEIACHCIVMYRNCKLEVNFLWKHEQIYCVFQLMLLRYSCKLITNKYPFCLIMKLSPIPLCTYTKREEGYTLPRISFFLFSINDNKKCLLSVWKRH